MQASCKYFKTLGESLVKGKICHFWGLNPDLPDQSQCMPSHSATLIQCLELSSCVCSTDLDAEETNYT